MAKTGTLGERASAALKRASVEFGLEAAEPRAQELLRMAAASWYDRPSSIQFPTLLLNDSPFELCVHLPPHDVSQLRFTLAPAGEEARLMASYKAMRKTFFETAPKVGIETKWMENLWDVCEPGEDKPMQLRAPIWAGWLGGVVTPSGKTTFKAYFHTQNAMDKGVPVDEILAAAGLDAKLRDQIPDDVKAELGALTVDQTKDGVARTKLYFAQVPPSKDTPAWLDRLGAITEQYKAGDAMRLLGSYGEVALDDGPAFVDGHFRKPFVSTTLHAVGGDKFDRLTVSVVQDGPNRPPSEVLEKRTRDAIRLFGTTEEPYDKFIRVVGVDNISVLTHQRQRGLDMLTLYGSVDVFDEDAVMES